MQLIELNIPMVIALNMMDEVRANGGTIKISELQEELGVPVVPISASKNEGIDELVDVAVETAANRHIPKRLDFCTGAVHRAIHSRCPPHRGPRRANRCSHAFRGNQAHRRGQAHDGRAEIV